MGYTKMTKNDIIEKILEIELEIEIAFEQGEEDVFDELHLEKYRLETQLKGVKK